MSGVDFRATPPLQPGIGLEDAWFCYEYRVNNEDFVSPWFDDEFEIFEYLEDEDEFLLTRKFVRTSDGVRECNGLGDLLDLEVVDLDELNEPSPHTSAEDEVA